MCGIYFYPKNLNVPDDHFKRHLHHRGPDYQNQINTKDFVIGHTLLSIRGDVKISNQPCEIDTNYLLSFNGEIYNTNYILKKFNLVKSPSDTNILSQLISKVGKKFIDYIEGMYAIILFNTKTEEVSIYRDHSGQKNIYYYNSSKGLVLSSEVLPIVKLESFEKEINFEYISEALVMGYATGNQTIFKRIKKLKPGEQISFDKHGSKIFSKITKKAHTNELIEKSIYDSIDETVKNHTLSDYKVGINLSGGLDANIVLHHAIKHKSNIEAFSTFFEDADEKYNSDFEKAKKISNYYGIKFNEVIITKKAYENAFSKSFSSIEEINRNIGNPTYFLNYNYQSQKNFKTILTGDGGDEIFVGYDWYFKGRFREKLLRKICFMGKKINSMLFIYNYFSQFDRYNFFKNKEFINSNKLHKKKKFLDKIKDSELFINENFLNKIYQFDYFKLFLDQYLWLPNEILMRADKLGMFHSLEIRNPLCDQNLRKKMFYELDKTDFKTCENKQKIKKIYASKIPLHLIDKKKTGWTSPKEWMISEKIKSDILDNVPSYNSEFFNWIDFKNKIKKNDSIMSNRSIYPLISLIFLMKKFNLSF